MFPHPIKELHPAPDHGPIMAIIAAASQPKAG
jgi:hypothetical protein